MLHDARPFVPCEMPIQGQLLEGYVGLQNRKQVCFQPRKQVPVQRRQRAGWSVHDELFTVGLQEHPTGFEVLKQIEGIHSSNTSRSRQASEKAAERSSPSSPSSPAPFSRALLAWWRSSPLGKGSSPSEKESSLPRRFSGPGDDGDDGDAESPALSVSITMRRPFALPRPALPNVTDRPILRRFGARRLSWPLNELARFGQSSALVAFSPASSLSCASSSLGLPSHCSWSAINWRSASTMG